jgi:hypothetical protein
MTCRLVSSLTQSSLPSGVLVLTAKLFHSVGPKLGSLSPPSVQQPVSSGVPPSHSEASVHPNGKRFSVQSLPRSQALLRSLDPFRLCSTTDTPKLVSFVPGIVGIFHPNQKSTLVVVPQLVFLPAISLKSVRLLAMQIQRVAHNTNNHRCLLTPPFRNELFP